MRYYLTLVRMTIIKKPTTSPGEGMEEREPSCFACGYEVHLLKIMKRNINNNKNEYLTPSSVFQM